MAEIKVCKTCGKIYQATPSMIKRGTKYCSRKCKSLNQSSNVTCVECGKTFNLPKSFIASNLGNKNNYCSRKCYDAHRIKNVNVICNVCGKTFSVWVSRYNKGEVKYCSRECKGKYMSSNVRGENNPSYRDGSTDRTRKRTSLKEWKDIAQSIRDERGNICEICGAQGGKYKLPVHHKIPWEISHDNSRNNLIVVCKKHHCELDFAYMNYGIIPI